MLTDKLEEKDGEDGDTERAKDAKERPLLGVGACVVRRRRRQRRQRGLRRHRRGPECADLVSHGVGSKKRKKEEEKAKSLRQS